MDRDGGSQLWPVKGTLVSTVMVVESSVEKGRRLRKDEEDAVERGLSRLELRRAKAISSAVFDRSIDRSGRFSEGGWIVEKRRRQNK